MRARPQLRTRSCAWRRRSASQSTRSSGGITQSVPGCGQGGGGFGPEEELAEELVLPHAEAQAAGDATARAHHGERFEAPELRADACGSRGRPGRGGCRRRRRDPTRRRPSGRRGRWCGADRAASVVTSGGSRSVVASLGVDRAGGVPVVGQRHDGGEPVLRLALEADGAVGSGGVVHRVVHRHHVEVGRRAPLRDGARRRVDASPGGGASPRRPVRSGRLAPARTRRCRARPPCRSASPRRSQSCVGLWTREHGEVAEGHRAHGVDVDEGGPSVGSGGVEAGERLAEPREQVVGAGAVGVAHRSRVRVLDVEDPRVDHAPNAG